MKKYFIKIFFAVLILTEYSFSQWSNDPNNTLIVGYGLDPHICSDSAGGCYITYDYNSTSYPRWLAVERLDKYGYKPWGINKRILGEYPGQSKAQVIEDGEGGVIVSYEDRLENLPSWTANIRVQKVDSNGNFLWGQTGVRVTLEEINQGLQQLVSDGEGGCVVTWKTISSVFYVNRINESGERLWSDSGKVLGISNYSGTEPRIIRAADGSYYAETGEYIYRIRENGEIVRRDSVILGNILPDPEGGIVLSGRVGSINNRRLAAQRKDSLGNNLWQEPYVEIADSLHFNSHLSIQYNEGYFYYGWYGKKNGIDKVAQFQALRLDGSKLFQNGSIQVGTPPLNGTIVVPLEQNRTAFIYYNKDFLPDSLLVQTYDTLGNKLWKDNGILIAHPPIEYQSYSTDGNGGFIIGGVINNFTIVAQQVSEDGNLGEIITSVEQEEKITRPMETSLHQNFPNPFNSSTIIRFQLSKESVIKIELYNVLGEKIQMIVAGFYSEGTHSVNFSSDNLPSGIYLYKMQTETKSLTKKLIIIK